MARLLDGFTGGNISVARAYATDITSEKDRPKGMAIIGMAFGAGFILGPAIGGILFGMSHSHFLPALVAAGMSLLAFVITFFGLEEPDTLKKTKSHLKNLSAIKALFTKKNIILILVAQLVYMVVFSGFETTFALFTNQYFDYTEKDNSLIFMYLGILALFIQGGITRRTPKNLKRVTGFGLMTVAISFILLGVFPTMLLNMVALAILAVGIGFVNAYLPALLSVTSGGENQGAVMGVYESFGSMSRIIGPLLAYLTIYHSLKWGYIVFGSILGVLTVIFLMQFIPKKEANDDNTNH